MFLCNRYSCLAIIVYVSKSESTAKLNKTGEKIMARATLAFKNNYSLSIESV